MRGMVDVMHKEEEEKLMQFKERIDDKKIPHMLINESISHGLNKAKVDKKPLRHRLIFGIAAILILLVGCVATFWVVNPELLNDNKGLKDAINHEYYQEINVSENIDGMEVTFNGAIVDEKSFVLFYDIRTNEKFLEVDMNDLEVTDEQGNEIDGFSIRLVRSYLLLKTSHFIGYHKTVQNFFMISEQMRSFRSRYERPRSNR